MTTPKYKLDVFQVLDAINKKDRIFYDELTEEEQKAFVPFVTMRWLTGTKDSAQILFVNEFVNPYVFSLLNHKPLLYKLMLTCTTGKARRYSWIKLQNGKGSSFPLATGIVGEYFGYNKRESRDAIKVLSNSQILSFAEYLGRQNDEITKLKAELKNR